MYVNPQSMLTSEKVVDVITSLFSATIKNASIGPTIGAILVTTLVMGFVSFKG